MARMLAHDEDDDRESDAPPSEDGTRIERRLLDRRSYAALAGTAALAFGSAGVVGDWLPSPGFVTDAGSGRGSAPAGTREYGANRFGTNGYGGDVE